MSETYFAVRNSQTPIKGGKRTAAKMDKIAKGVNAQAGYTYYLESATGLYRGWGYGAVVVPIVVVVPAYRGWGYGGGYRGYPATVGYHGYTGNWGYSRFRRD